MSETGVTIEPPKQEMREPVKNQTGFDKLFHARGYVTRKGEIPTENGERLERPLALRSVRAELYKEIIRLRKENKKGAIPRAVLNEQKQSTMTEVHARDEVVQQYLNQGEAKVNLEGWGIQSGRYVDIRPPESTLTPETENLPPIFFIPGISNDLDSAGSFIQEVAMSGRRIISLGQPESFMGTITPQFAEAVSKSDGLEPHVDFYKAAFRGFLEKLQTEEQPGNSEEKKTAQMELWGQSLGAEIIARLLADESIREHVPNAVLINPASSKDMSQMQLLAGGGVGELKHLISRLKLLPRYSRTSARLPTVEPESPQQRELKKKVFGNLLGKVRTNYESWKTARVQEGGSIIVVSGRGDTFTRSADTFRADPQTVAHLRESNPQIGVVDIDQGAHMSSFLEPKKYVDEIAVAQGRR